MSLPNQFFRPLSFFNQPLMAQLNPDNQLMLLQNTIDWNDLISDLSGYFSENVGRPSIPIRLMAGLSIVKFLFNLSDAKTIEMYTENPYVQSFCGEVEFQKEAPCSDAMMTIFRNRIGESGCNKIFKASVKIHGKDAMESEVVVDTTAEPKNITFPTDMKLVAKVIIRCQKCAEKYGINFKNTYKSEIKKLLRTIRFEKSQEKKDEVKKAKRRLITIAGILLRELLRKLSNEDIESENENFKIYEKVIEQAKHKEKSFKDYQGEFENLQGIIDQCKEYLENNNISVGKDIDEKINNCKTEFQNAKGRGKTKAINNALKGMKNIARILIKKIEKKVSGENFEKISDQIVRLKDLLSNEKKDQKIYSLHEPNAACIAKGKSGKKYEFGSKASIATTKNSSIIVGAKNFQGNPHDSDTLDETLDQVEAATGQRPSVVFADRGYKGSDKKTEAEVHLPSAPNESATEEEKEEAIKNFGRRSAIEPIIGHVKNDFRMSRVFLKGVLGDAINLLLSCAAFNFKKMINKLKNDIENKKKNKKKK